MKFKVKELKKKHITEELFNTLKNLSNSTVTDIDEGKKQFKKIKKNKNHHIYVAIDKDSKEVIGLITLLVEPKFIHDNGYLGHIEDVVTRKGFEGQGIGKELVSQANKEAAKEGCYRVILNCSDENMDFYEKLGFKKRENEMALELTK